ncbi:MAG: alpha-amylase family glycosyl hydrolase [Rubricoccaceae bacterium]|nr:alpha-amylase family glycosyl hydrolase [Rubricoccaceae bacterium]
MPKLPSAGRLLLLALVAVLAACAPPAPSTVPETALSAAPARAAWVDDAVLYEVFVRSATPEGTFRALIPRLDSLQAMGVTTLWLMPIHPVGEARRKGRLGSPYSVRDYRAVDPAFGTLDDFRALVDAVHARGMTLILDWVANHTAFDHAWVTAHPEWYTQDADGTIVHPEGTDWTDVADLDFSEPALRDAMIAEMRYWVEAFGVDGYRADVAGLVPQDFWAEAIATLREVRPVLMLAEGNDAWLYEVGFDLTYAWNTYRALLDIWEGAPPDALYETVAEEDERFPPGALRLRFITNHDETSWDDAAVVKYGGVEGTQAAMVVAATLPGVPLLYNGQEVAAPQRMNLFEDEKIDWSLNPQLRGFYATLLQLSRESRALREGLFAPLALGPDVIAYTRRHGDERVAVVVNPRTEPQPVALPEGALAPAMRDVFTGEAPAASFTLPPHGFRVYRAGG